MAAKKKRTKGAAVPTKAGYHHGDLRSALLRASIGLIERDGVEALSLREAARAAGVSPAAPYHHFGSKAQLLGAIAGEGFGGLATAMHAALAALPDPDEPEARLQALGRAYVAFALAQPTAFRLMFRPGLVTQGDLPRGCDPTAAFQLLMDAVARVAAQIAPDVAAPPALALTAWSLVHGAAELVLDGPLRERRDDLAVTPEEVGPTVVRTLGALLGRARR